MLVEEAVQDGRDANLAIRKGLGVARDHAAASPRAHVVVVHVLDRLRHLTGVGVVEDELAAEVVGCIVVG